MQSQTPFTDKQTLNDELNWKPKSPSLSFSLSDSPETWVIFWGFQEAATKVGKRDNVLFFDSLKFGERFRTFLRIAVVCFFYLSIYFFIQRIYVLSKYILSSCFFLVDELDWSGGYCIMVQPFVVFFTWFLMFVVVF